ncbi:MAG: hypothetical protein KIT34_10985 [Cyanobacteria bacterium TGS_CYA1]|nr:hypothetical protein [Cyanobacteria bacterium TGS_CYA1]MDX2104939.1 hypothetical protein [Candidatus Melainabacteria bacterium]
MSQNTRLLLIALGIIIVFGIFLQSFIAKNLQETSSGLDTMPDFKYSSADPNNSLKKAPPGKKADK